MNLLSSPSLLCAAIGLLSVECLAIGTTVVEFSVVAQVTGKDAAGNVWHAAPAEIITRSRDPIANTPFPILEFQGKIFSWQISIGALAFGSRIRSNIGAPVCFRFDQAYLTSSSQSNELPLRVLGTVHRPSKGQPIFLINKPGQTKLFHAVPFCFGSERAEHFDVSPDLADLFPSGKMFNLRLSDNGAIVDSGIGNWLKIKVPIEYDGKREDVVVTLTAKAAKSRTSVH